MMHDGTSGNCGLTRLRTVPPSLVLLARQLAGQMVMRVGAGAGAGGGRKRGRASRMLFGTDHPFFPPLEETGKMAERGGELGRD